MDKQITQVIIGLLFVIIALTGCLVYIGSVGGKPYETLIETKFIENVTNNQIMGSVSDFYHKQNGEWIKDTTKINTVGKYDCGHICGVKCYVE